MNNFLDQLVVWLEGKKTIILGIVAISVPFVVQLSLVDPIVGNWILAICGFFGIGAKLISNAAVNNDTPLGQAILQKRNLKN